MSSHTIVNPAHLPRHSPQESVPSMLSNSDNSLTLDSFIPILSHLPGFYLDQNLYVYHIHGTIEADDWARLRDYTRMVSKFVVTDAGNKNPEAQVSPAILFRLALCQEPETPFFPSLSHLVIADADASISYLELMLTPSLKSLEVSRIPDAQQSTFFSFLTTATQKVPLLQTLIFGPGRFITSSLQTILQFKYLRHLELKHEDSKMPVAFFENISYLPKLEAFTLDARYVSSTVSETQSNNLEKPTVPTGFDDVNPLSSDKFSDSNSMDGKSIDTFSQTCPTSPISKSGAFKQLTKLHVIGWLPFLEDIILGIMSTKLEDISITLIRSSHEELQVNLGKGQERGNEEERGEKVTEFSSMWDPINEEPEAREAQERLLKEREGMLKEQASASFDVHTASFTELLRTLYCLWRASLKTVSISQIDGSFLEPPLLSKDIFRDLLFLPALESLEVKSWMLDESVESVLGVAKAVPNLKVLLLPVEGTNPGISLRTLRHIAETCPKLESFQCRMAHIKPRSAIPEYTIPTTQVLSHGLRTLSIGNSPLRLRTKELCLIARHLDLLFPHIELITICEEGNANQWVVVSDLVKMCQAARVDERCRNGMQESK